MNKNQKLKRILQKTIKDKKCIDFKKSEKVLGTLTETKETNTQLTETNTQLPTNARNKENIANSMNLNANPVPGNIHTMLNTATHTAGTHTTNNTAGTHSATHTPKRIYWYNDSLLLFKNGIQNQLLSLGSIKPSSSGQENKPQSSGQVSRQISDKKTNQKLLSKWNFVNNEIQDLLSRHTSSIVNRLTIQQTFKLYLTGLNEFIPLELKIDEAINLLKLAKDRKIVLNEKDFTILYNSIYSISKKLYYSNIDESTRNSHQKISNIDESTRKHKLYYSNTRNHQKISNIENDESTRNSHQKISSLISTIYSNFALEKCNNIHAIILLRTLSFLPDSLPLSLKVLLILDQHNLITFRFTNQSNIT